MVTCSSWTLPGELAGITLLYDFVTEAEERYILEVSLGAIRLDRGCKASRN